MTQSSKRFTFAVAFFFLLGVRSVVAGPVVLAAGKVDAAPGKEVVVPIELKAIKQAKAVRGLSMRLNYDPEVLTYKSVEQGPALTRALLGDDVDPKADPGKLALGFVCTFKTPTSKELTSIDDDGVVLKVTFTVNPNAKSGQKSALTIDNFRVVDTSTPPFEMAATAENGEVKVTSVGGALQFNWILIGIVAAIVLVILLIVVIVAAVFGRGKKKQPVGTAVPSFAPEATRFAHTCVKCGGVIQLPSAMMGQVFQCSACGAQQTAGG